MFNNLKPKHARTCTLSLTRQTRGVGRAMRLGWVCKETKRGKPVEHFRAISLPTGRIQPLFPRSAKTQTRITTKIGLTSFNDSRRRGIRSGRMSPLARGPPLAPWRLSTAPNHDRTSGGCSNGWRSTGGFSFPYPSVSPRHSLRHSREKELTQEERRCPRTFPGTVPSLPEQAKRPRLM